MLTTKRILGAKPLGMSRKLDLSWASTVDRDTVRMGYIVFEKDQFDPGDSLMRRTQMTRRTFAKQLALAGAGLKALGAGGHGTAAPKSQNPGETPVSLQLYTVRNLADKDLAGTLAQVARIGYDAVECGEPKGFSSKEVKKFLSDSGLQCSGIHESFERLESELPAVIDYSREMGNQFVICSYMPESYQKRGVDGFKEFGLKLTRIGAAIKKAELQLCYHNHDFEFKKVNGAYLLDTLFATADPALVKAEVDVYWVEHGGEDPVAHLRKYANRCPLVHMKDMTKDDRKTYAPVGTGRLDMKGIVEAARAGGAVWFVVEQDETDQPALEAIQISLTNLRQILKA
jgi:sugar phosphate isomerase/epimerase